MKMMPAHGASSSKVGLQCPHASSESRRPRSDGRFLSKQLSPQPSPYSPSPRCPPSLSCFLLAHVYFPSFCVASCSGKEGVWPSRRKQSRSVGWLPCSLHVLKPAWTSPSPLDAPPRRLSLRVSVAPRLFAQKTSVLSLLGSQGPGLWRARTLDQYSFSLKLPLHGKDSPRPKVLLPWIVL